MFVSSLQDSVKYINERQIEVRTSLKHRLYKFDHVFSDSQGPRDVFQKGCKDIIDKVFNEKINKGTNQNGLIFMYGNTGTGKTHSMGLLNLVDGSSRGIVPDSFRYIFSIISMYTVMQIREDFLFARFLFLLVKFIWMKYMIYWRWNLIRS